MLHHRDGARFPLEVTLVIQVKEFNLGFIRSENLVSHGVSAFGAFWQTPRAVMCLLLRSGFRLATLPYISDWWSAAEMVFLRAFNAVDICWYPSPDLCLDTILSWSSTDNSFDLMAWFLL